MKIWYVGWVGLIHLRSFSLALEKYVHENTIVLFTILLYLLLTIFLDVLKSKIPFDQLILKNTTDKIKFLLTLVLILQFSTYIYFYI